MLGRRLSQLGISCALAVVLAGALAFGQDTTAQTASVTIPVPDDALAKAAFDVLEAKCSRCHQEGRLVDKTKPSKNFGFILMLDKLAEDPHYVTPGNPDDSKIIKMILNEEMPYDYFYDGAIDKEPVNAEELVALRDWIGSLGKTQAAACTGREFITPESMAAAMLADLGNAQKSRVDDTRYLTLTHLYNACTGEADMAVYRQGAVKLLNSLSRNSDVAKLETIDPEQTIVRFTLSDLGWTTAEWDTVLSVYPYAAVPDSVEFEALAEATETPLPYVQADWFGFVASQPPLYYRLLDMPADFAGLQVQQGVDVAANIANYLADRAGFQRSGVSVNNRLIERHTIDTGYFWTSYDFGGNRDRQSLFDFPLGPDAGDFSFSHDGGETIFSLPNGFQGYFLNTAEGARLDKGPTNIVRDTSKRDLAVTNGLSCMGCHEIGIRKAKDDIRPRVLVDRNFPKAVRDAVDELYPPSEEMDAQLEADTVVFRSAMLAAGLDPNLKLNGVEMINALAGRYEQDVEIQVAAAQYGLTVEEYSDSVTGAANADAVRMGRRLMQGLVPRDTFEAQFDDTFTVVSDLVPVDLSSITIGGVVAAVAPVARPVEESRSFDLAITSDKASYKVDDKPVFTVTTDRACYLTLIDVDRSGSATVLYPNAFEQKNLLPAGKPFEFPAKDSQFQFRLADAGTETVIAICSLSDRPADGISYDFANNDLTDLGDYTQYLSRKITVEAKPSSAQASSDIVVRTAVQVEVR